MFISGYLRGYDINCEGRGAIGDKEMGGQGDGARGEG